MPINTKLQYISAVASTFLCSISLAQTEIADEKNVSIALQPEIETKELPADSSFEINPLIGVGFTTGGETLGEVTYFYEDGDTSSESVKSGGFLSAFAGIEVLSLDLPISGQVTMGYHWDRLSADNGAVSWSRMPLDFVGFYHFEKVKLGFGLTYALNPKLEVAGNSFDFESSLGMVFEVGSNFGNNENWWYHFRYVKINYDQVITDQMVIENEIADAYFNESVQPISLNGDYFGLMIQYKF